MKKTWTLEELYRLRFGQWTTRGGPSLHHLRQLENWKRGKILELLRLRRERRNKVALAAVVAVTCLVLALALAVFVR